MQKVYQQRCSAIFLDIPAIRTAILATDESEALKIMQQPLKKAAKLITNIDSKPQRDRSQRLLHAGFAAFLWFDSQVLAAILACGKLQ